MEFLIQVPVNGSVDIGDELRCVEAHNETYIAISDFCVFVLFYIFLVEQRQTKNIVQNMLTIALSNKKSQVSEDIACVNGEDCFEY